MTTLRKYTIVQQIGDEYLVHARQREDTPWFKVGYLNTREAANDLADALEDNKDDRADYIELADDDDDGQDH